MEGLLEILGVALAAIAVPLAAIIGVYLARMLKQVVSRLDCERKEHWAWLAINWTIDQFPGLVKTKQFEEAVRWMADKVPGMDRKEIEDFIRAMFTAKKEALEMGKNAEGSSKK